MNKKTPEHFVYRSLLKINVLKPESYINSQAGNNSTVSVIKNAYRCNIIPVLS